MLLAFLISVTPVGINATPTAMNAAITIRGVIMGCQADIVCCMKGVFLGRFSPATAAAGILEDDEELIFR